LGALGFFDHSHHVAGTMPANARSVETVPLADGGLVVGTGTDIRLDFLALRVVAGLAATAHE
jgi:hypothetical protein